MLRNARLIALAVIGLLIAAGNPLFSSEFVGQVISSDTILDEQRVPAGTTIHTGAIVKTNDDLAVLHLATGQLVQVAENSSAVLTGNGDGVQLAVLTGELAYREANGETIALSAGASSSLFQDPEIGGGTPVVEGDPSELIALCHLDGGDYDRVKVARRDLQSHLEHGDVFADKELRTGDMDPDVDCGKKVALWWAAGGAALVTGAVLADDDSKAGPSTASPIVP